MVTGTLCSVLDRRPRGNCTQKQRQKENGPLLHGHNHSQKRKRPLVHGQKHSVIQSIGTPVRATARPQKNALADPVLGPRAVAMPRRCRCVRACSTIRGISNQLAWLDVSGRRITRAREGREAVERDRRAAQPRVLGEELDQKVNDGRLAAVLRRAQRDRDRARRARRRACRLARRLARRRVRRRARRRARWRARRHACRCSRSSARALVGALCRRARRCVWLGCLFECMSV